MPLVYQQNINVTTKAGLWHITETEDFFIKKVSLQQGISHMHKRLQHLAGRWLLKELYPSFPLELILIASSRKPFLEEDLFHFSISHCGDYAAAIVSSTHRVGVDVEEVTNKIRRITHKFLSEKELSLIPEKDFNRIATLFWGVKETIYKWQGSGGVDFIKHIHIKKIEGSNEGLVHCVFMGQVPLQVHYNFFNNTCLCHVMSESNDLPNINKT